MSELKQCPRCGAEAHVVTEDSEPTMFLCEDCGYWLDVSEFETTENAFKWWNDRPFIDALHARIAELGSELGRKSVELGELVGENILWKVINDELKSRRENLERENDRLQEKVSDLLKRIAELEEALSWKPKMNGFPRMESDERW